MEHSVEARSTDCHVSESIFETSYAGFQPPQEASFWVAPNFHLPGKPIYRTPSRYP